ncbi:MAG: MarR family transcriptional regulator, partial [bacterium]
MSQKIAQLVNLLVSTKRMLRERANPGEKIDPISFMQLETLRLIDNKKEVTMARISDYFGIKAPSATSLINNLEKKGEVVRVNDKNDRRKVILKVTAKGKKYMALKMKKISRRAEEIFQQLNDEEVNSLMNILNKINNFYS